MIDIFNKKKLKKLEDEKNYYENVCETKNKTINDLQKDKSDLNKNMNNLIRENQKLIEWIQKILEVANTQEVNNIYDSITIPIYKHKSERYSVYDEWRTEEEVQDVVIPQIHFKIVNQIRY